ncbi:hypothetical protein GQ457_05G035420 [Hibiscus cannabinus]
MCLDLPPNTSTSPDSSSTFSALSTSHSSPYKNSAASPIEKDTTGNPLHRLPGLSSLSCEQHDPRYANLLLPFQLTDGIREEYQGGQHRRLAEDLRSCSSLDPSFYQGTSFADATSLRHGSLVDRNLRNPNQELDKLSQC